MYNRLTSRAKLGNLNYFGGSPNGWTDEQVQEIEEKYFPGFLNLNPHYPAPGYYTDGLGWSGNPSALIRSNGGDMVKTYQQVNSPLLINGFWWDKFDYQEKDP